MSPDLKAQIKTVLQHYELGQVTAKPLAIGLINETYLLSNDHKANVYVMQQVNGMLDPNIHKDIDTVTSYLHNKEILTPQLIRTKNNRLFYRQDEACWRIYNYVEGKSYSTINEPNMAEEAGKMLGCFHTALADLEYDFLSSRKGTHDTTKHLQHLQQTLKKQHDHPQYQQILPIAESILNTAKTLSPLPTLTERNVHGDPKINNFLFDEKTKQAVCMVDFDTLAKMLLPLELGDAFRSWCNPAGEDTDKTDFSVTLFEKGLQGYASQTKDFITEQEWQSIPDTTFRIYIELASRFCADALNENYFGWDSNNFSSHSEHSLIRAKGQLNAASALKNQYSQVQDIVKAIFT